MVSRPAKITEPVIERQTVMGRMTMTRKIKMYSKLICNKGTVGVLSIVLTGLLLASLPSGSVSAAAAKMTAPVSDISESTDFASRYLLLAQATKKDDDLLADDDEDEDLLADDDKDGKDDDLLTDDDKDGKDDDLLADDKEEDEKSGSETATGPTDEAGAAHTNLFAESRYPSANTCKVCHPVQYDQWSVSQHAYAQLSPVFTAMQRTINAVTSATNGDFCIRCHTPVGMNMGESTNISNLDRHPTSREGITCVACHRLNVEYGKVSGRIALVEGDILKPVFGPKGNAELARVLDNPKEYQVVTEQDATGRKIHTKVGHFPQLSTSGFCGICHDVNLFNGFRLEEAFSEYKNSPAAGRGESCQDCHMGKVQGVVSGYVHGPAAVVGGVPTKSRKLTDHFFAGPDYSLVHPGIFPHNADAVALADLREWLQFDYKAGWGTDEFEDNLPDNASFPEAWGSVDDRYDAREILKRQFRLLDLAEKKRLEVLKNGYKLGKIETLSANADGIEFRVQVSNGTDGHNVPTGFDAERLVWLEVTVTNSDGKVVYRSGDLDPNGDLRDSHSLYVHNGELPLDNNLFSLQSRFLTRNVRGGVREQVLPVNFSVDPLPFVRPFTRSVVLSGQPAGARKHRTTIPPLASRWGTYQIPAGQLTGSGKYMATVRLKSGALPINLIDAIKGVGFDYGMSTRQVADGIVAGHQVLWEQQATFETK
jgi:hypothetical protein